MKSYKLKISILAAGKSSRLKSSIPKAIVKLNNKPIINYLLDSINKSLPNEEIIIVLSQSNRIKIEKTLKSYNHIIYCIQEKQLGTGDAVKSILENLDIVEDNLLVLLADHPFIRGNTIKKIIEKHSRGRYFLTMLTAKVPHYNGIFNFFYRDGRIIRNSRGEIKAVLELNELSDDQLNQLKEINPSIYIFNLEWLKKNIKKLRINVEKQEYYLTHLINIAFNQGIKINSLTVDALEVFGINTPEQLKEARKLIKKNQV